MELEREIRGEKMSITNNVMGYEDNSKKIIRKCPICGEENENYKHLHFKELVDSYLPEFDGVPGSNSQRFISQRFIVYAYFTFFCSKHGKYGFRCPVEYY